MKNWKAYISLQIDLSRFYDIQDIEVSDEEYEELSKCVALKKPLDELDIYQEIVSRAVDIEKETLREILLDDEDDLDVMSEEDVAAANKATSYGIEYGKYHVFLEDPNVSVYLRNHFLNRRCDGLENREIPFKIITNDPLKTVSSVKFVFDENGVIKEISDIEAKAGRDIITIFSGDYPIYPDYKTLISIIERMLYRQKDYDGDLGTAGFPGYNPLEDEDPFDIELERRYRRLRGEPDLSQKPEEIKEEKPAEVIRPVKEVIHTVPESEIKTVVKKEVREQASSKLIPTLLLVLLLGICAYIYVSCFIPKSVVTFDVSKLTSYEIDGYYDVFDSTCSSQKEIEDLLDYLGRFKYVKVLNPFEKARDNGQRIGVTLYDKKGKKLEEIIVYSDERISVNGSLCKPVEMDADCFFLPGYLKRNGEKYIEEALKPAVEELIKNATFEDDSVIIDVIDIPFEGGTYSKITAKRTDAKTGREKTDTIFSKFKQNYEHQPGYKMKIDFNLAVGEEKVYSLWLYIDACDVTVGYNLSDLIPENYRAE